ncbi:MAG: EF2563 family selenium-dependent molybdenum hydroxylase system protein [Mogibacterium sp.]|nr:EF2563 family selenium-dependent molybdenum hydroxylase system protein [Mogibacterium sp.]
MLVMIRGAGDLASGIAVRLYRAGFRIVMTEIDRPLSIRRTVCFSEAVRQGEAVVEGIKAVHVCDGDNGSAYSRNGGDDKNRDHADDRRRAGIAAALDAGMIAVVTDPEARIRDELHPDVFIDACLAKRNLGTRIDFAPVVIGIGPGFTAGTDCHAVIETMRGHTLGRVIYEGCALPDTKTPGNIGGYTIERLLRTPCAGTFRTVRSIGDIVEAGETVAEVDGMPVTAQIRGVLRGLLADDTAVPEGLKCGDVDPRCQVENCATASDKALAIGGGVLEAILALAGNPYK